MHSHGEMNVTGGGVAAAVPRRTATAIVDITRIIGASYHFVVAMWSAKKQNLAHMKMNTPYLVLVSLITCFAALPRAQAVSPPPDGCYPNYTTAAGCNALNFLTTGAGNTGIGWYSLFDNSSGNYNTAVGGGALTLNNADSNTAVGAAALLLNTTGTQNTAVGTDAMVFNNSGDFNVAVGAFALDNNTTGFSNNAFGFSALVVNHVAVNNTAIGDVALVNNDGDAAGLGSGNTAVGAAALFSNVDGSDNTAVGDNAGPNIITGFNNTYIGDFVGTEAPDESSTIRIGDFSNGNGAGSLECYIGGIFNNFQPRSATVVVVTLDLSNDHLGWDVITSPNEKGGQAPVQVPQRGVPAPRGPLQPAAHPQHQAMVNDRVEKLQTMIAQQQRQIETLTAQLREQAVQLQRVSTQIAISKSGAKTALNNQ
jgi:hypothetical protein